jgi:hypothetical protein
MIDDLGRDLSLQAQRLASGMPWVRIERRKPAVGYGGNCTASRHAEGAETSDALAILIGHGRSHSSLKEFTCANLSRTAVY